MKPRIIELTRNTIMVTACTLLIGAWVCASLSEVDARYLARVSWLLPLAASLVIARWLSARS